MRGFPIRAIAGRRDEGKPHEHDAVSKTAPAPVSAVTEACVTR